MNRKVEDKIAVVTGSRAFIIEAPRYSQPLDKVVEHTRKRAAEFHLNGTCLVRAICAELSGKSLSPFDISGAHSPNE
jgi:hypothetical protein